MSKLVIQAAMADNASMDDDSLRVANRIRESSGEGRGMNVTQGGIFKERGGKKEKKDEENIDEYEEEDEDEEEDDDSVVNQPSTRGPKPAGRESWAKERWAPRNAFRKARKLAARQKQQHQGAAETAMGSGHKAKVAKWAEEAAEKAKKQGEQETAEKATAEKTVSSERTREITWLPINSQFLPSPQYQQGDLAEYTNLGRREHPGTAYQTLCRAPNSVPARAMTWMSSRFAEELSSLSRTPQHMQDYISPYNDTHPIPARPGPASPINTARASPTVKSKYRRIQKAEEKKMETVEEAVERVRGERKKMEERKSTEEEREEFERERKKMDEEWKKVGRERKKMEKQRKKGGKKRMEEDEEEEM